MNSTTKKINTFYASLLDAQNNFCEDIDDVKPPVCNTSDIPLSESLITRLLNEIERENTPSAIRVSRTKTFLDAKHFLDPKLFWDPKKVWDPKKFLDAKN